MWGEISYTLLSHNGEILLDNECWHVEDNHHRNRNYTLMRVLFVCLFVYFTKKEGQKNWESKKKKSRKRGKYFCIKKSGKNRTNTSVVTLGENMLNSPVKIDDEICFTKYSPILYTGYKKWRQKNY